ncbi:MAG: alpha/beta fold hydrolase [Austwickia sp.]|nr:alpha/beta fold hydrolase [Austwickia sp.]
MSTQSRAKFPTLCLLGSAGLLALAVVADLGSTAAAVVPIASEPVAARTGGTAPAAAAVPKPRWQACGDGTECTTITVPLDHRRRVRGTIELAVARMPASNPRRRVGALFVNPGGPGAPSSMYLADFAQTLGPDVTARFDLIGIDPRGVGGSAPFSCTVSVGTYGMPELSRAYPVTVAETRLHVAHDDYLRRSCARAKAQIQSFMTTADSARDMDVVRAALGEKTLNYYGMSYGSYLGLTYANLFPKTVRTMVLDGVLDPISWSTGQGSSGTRTPVSARTGSASASWAALNTVFRACATAPAGSCPQGTAAARQWSTITARLRRGPLRYAGERLYLQDLIQAVQTELYDGRQLSELMWQLHDLHRAIAPAAAGRGSAASADPRATDRVRASISALRAKAKAQAAAARPAPWSRTWSGRLSAGSVSSGGGVTGTATAAMTLRQDMGLVGVMCSDSVNPIQSATWSKVAADQNRRAPGFGPLWTWNSSMCAGWRAKAPNVYRGPFTAKPAHGLLLMANTGDGPTPAAGARTVRRLSPGSRLVLTDMVGHTTADASSCASRVRTRYLLTGALPNRDLTCQPDRPLFF